MFTGVTGVGKSVITVDALEGLRARRNVVPFTINFSAQTQSVDTQNLIESKLDKKRKTRWGHGGCSMCGGGGVQWSGARRRLGI